MTQKIPGKEEVDSLRLTDRPTDRLILHVVRLSFLAAAGEATVLAVAKRRTADAVEEKDAAKLSVGGGITPRAPEWQT